MTNLIHKNGETHPEKIVAEKWLRLIYDADNANQPASLASLISRKLLSRLYGAYCQTSHSRHLINSFLANNEVDLTGCAGSYENFAQFFAREKKGIVFPQDAQVLGSPCEGLASVYEDIDPNAMVAAKGCEYTLAELFGSAASNTKNRNHDSHALKTINENDCPMMQKILDENCGERLAQRYRGGTCLRLRITPTDYHRMHFFDDGEVTDATFIDGDLHSVNPLAVAKIARLYCRNKRVRVQVATRNFGHVTLMEVGATFVGSIVHRFLVGDKARRGRQASYFLPGGSLVLAFFEKGAVNLDAGIVSRTAAGIETRVQVGDPIGKMVNSSIPTY
ncbi:MAG: phosphatidylserine decarboxylase [Defluviitaleaceae bacterium]|nr:phosphatidylserine decarboxylase [Defluviitaleaceae bacterium]